MKIVIEITENYYKACKEWHKNKMATVEQSLIATGKPYEERPLRCKDCKHQKKYWHEDKRMKEGGYWVYECDFISDPFESTPVCGEPEEYCSSAEKKGGAE